MLSISNHGLKSRCRTVRNTSTAALPKSKCRTPFCRTGQTQRSILTRLGVTCTQIPFGALPTWPDSDGIGFRPPLCGRSVAVSGPDRKRQDKPAVLQARLDAEVWRDPRDWLAMARWAYWQRPYFEFCPENG